MSRKTNVINYIITMAVTLSTLFVVVFLCNSRYNETLIDAMLKFLVGAILAGLVHTFVHELGHLILGKKNGFVFSAMTVWFFRWYKQNNKIKFQFVMMGEEAGYTEMIPVCGDNIAYRLKKMSSGGPLVSLIFAILGVPVLFIPSVSIWVFSIWAMFLPIGAYFFLSSALPASSYGVRNDGAVIYGINHNEDTLKVALNLLKIQAEMYQGKTPAEVEKSLYFDLPQLPEDDLNFIMLLNARYLYYLDCEDFENAKKITDRLVGLIDDMPKDFRAPVMVDALYNACTFDFNEKLADEITEDYERFLNNVNTATNVRAKLAYLLYVRREREAFDIFYKKGIREAKRCQIKGIELFETKLFDKMKTDYENV